MDKEAGTSSFESIPFVLTKIARDYYTMAFMRRLRGFNVYFAGICIFRSVKNDYSKADSARQCFRNALYYDKRPNDYEAFLRNAIYPCIIGYR
jgi:hypothetical protein